MPSLCKRKTEMSLLDLKCGNQIAGGKNGVGKWKVWILSKSLALKDFRDTGQQLEG